MKHLYLQQGNAEVIIDLAMFQMFTKKWIEWESHNSAPRI